MGTSYPVPGISGASVAVIATRSVPLAQTESPDPSPDAARRLAAIVESSDDAIIGTDSKGIILSWNRGATRLYEYSSAEMIGHSMSSLGSQDRAAVMENILGRIKEGHRQKYETVHRTKDGRPLDVSVIISAIENGVGAVVGAAVIIRDISDQKVAERALRASEERWRSTVESAVDAIIVIDSRGRIEAFNPSAERLFGYPEEEIAGQNISVLMPSPHREQHDRYIERYLATGERKIIGIGREVNALRKDGSAFPVRLAVGEMSIDGQPKFIGIVHDLTERVEMESRLREQTALTKLGEMAAVVAHEVKNPLAGVRGAIQVIGARLPQGSRDAQVMKDIIARLDALNELMKDLLLFARPPQPKLSSVSVVPLLETVADLVRQDPALKELAVTVDGSASPIRVDPELLKIVTHNLLLNSAHAMEGRGAVAVLVSADARGCSIIVADTGPGIPSEVREKLFTPFFTTKARGTGLGLSTAKRLIEAHGGTITIDCPPAGGTTVTLWLPLIEAG
jgi:two-component system, LuxR family, sensor kinase FixL